MKKVTYKNTDRMLYKLKIPYRYLVVS